MGPMSRSTARRYREPVDVGADEGARQRRLVARLVAGDETALGLLHDAHAGYVYSLALRVCRDRTMAEDITQEVFVQVWERADTYEPSLASVRTWLGLLAHRRAVDRVRREESRRTREDRDHRRGPGAPAPVDDVVLQTLTSERVRAALGGLPAEQRACVVLAYFEGRTFREVAATIGIPEGTAKSRIRLALGRLADALAPEVAQETLNLP